MKKEKMWKKYIPYKKKKKKRNRFQADSVFTFYYFNVSVT